MKEYRIVCDFTRTDSDGSKTSRKGLSFIPCNDVLPSYYTFLVEEVAVDCLLKVRKAVREKVRSNNKEFDETGVGHRYSVRNIRLQVRDVTPWGEMPPFLQD